MEADETSRLHRQANEGSFLLAGYGRLLYRVYTEVSNADRKAGMDMSGSEIRKARREDIGEIMELIAKCVQVMQDGGSDQWDDSYPNREIITQDLAKGTLFVYEEQAAISAIIVLDEDQAEQYEAICWAQEQGPYLIMHRLAVHPRVQGKGIARKLVAFAEEHARSSGYSSIRLDTYAKNTRALALYPSLGYERRGEVDFPGRTANFPVFEKVLTTEAE